MEERSRLSDLVDCDELLEFLTPTANGEKLSRKQYLQRYFDETGIVDKDFEAALLSTADYRERLERVYASTSWKITKPLRWLKTLFSGKGE